MRAPNPVADLALLAAHLECAPGTDHVRSLSENFAGATADTIEAILTEASRFADAHLVRLNDVADAEGCKIVDGRVKTARGHKAAWEAFVAGGWTSLDHPLEIGGQGLPQVLSAAVQEVFDRACPAFGMLPVPQRSAVKLVAAFGDDRQKAEWLPKWVAGEWGATICISEPEAGSDAGRIRTMARPDGAGDWLITGEKCWISFGDHDLTARIGHCLLARTPGAKPGGTGLSLFLVPDSFEQDDETVRNGVAVRRIEHKMGLHASPTCALGFEDARATMIGTEGRGLAQLFVMIINMRLSTGIEGVAIAGGALDLALAYAAERRQGGAGERAVPIAQHPDVQRQLLIMLAEVETVRGLIFAAANQADIAAYGKTDQERAEAAALLQWLLPIVKTMGGAAGFDVSSGAMQVFGGAGYTREWPVEQGARDARVLTILEGTTGMQAQDLVHRRLIRGDRLGYTVFVREAQAAAAACKVPAGAELAVCVDILAATTDALLARSETAQDIDAMATAYLELAGWVATAWIAARLASLECTDPASRRLIAAGRYRLYNAAAHATYLKSQTIAGTAPLDLFRDLAV